ncbi:unnamed protein product, partial [Ascophyllum nodosum]
DRDRLEANLRQTLGKKKGKKGASKKGATRGGSKASVPVSAGGDRGFGAAVAGKGQGTVPQVSPRKAAAFIAPDADAAVGGADDSDRVPSTAV